jgi:hypothetical protein
MRLFLFLGTSVIEWFAFLSLLFIVFRFPIKGYIIHMAFTALIISQFSFFLHDVLHIKPVAPIIQLVILTLFLWLMFRIHIFYSFLMATIGYILVIIIQAIQMLSFQWLNVFTIKELLESHNLQYFQQILFSLIVGCICLLLFRYRLGFNFIPMSEKTKIKLKGENIAFLAVTGCAAILLFITCLSIYTLSMGSFLVLLTFTIIIFCLFLYISFRKEKTAANMK